MSTPTPTSACDDCHFGTQFIEDPPKNPAKLSALLADGWVGCVRSLTLSRPCPCRSETSTPTPAQPKEHPAFRPPPAWALRGADGALAVGIGPSGNRSIVSVNAEGVVLVDGWWRGFCQPGHDEEGHVSFFAWLAPEAPR